jgi:hypothetical protein
MSLEEVAVHTGHGVLMGVDNNNLLIVCNPHGILDLQLRPYPIHLLKNVIILIKYVKLYINELSNYLIILKNEYHHVQTGKKTLLT